MEDGFMLKSLKEDSVELFCDLEKNVFISWSFYNTGA